MTKKINEWNLIFGDIVMMILTLTKTLWAFMIKSKTFVFEKIDFKVVGVYAVIEKLYMYMYDSQKQKYKEFCNCFFT